MKLKPWVARSQSSACPMRGAVLVPGKTRPLARLLDDHRLGEGDEVAAIDRLGDLQQLRMAGQAQGRVGVLQRSENDERHLFGQVGCRHRLEHLYHVAAIGEIRAAERIAERLGPHRHGKIRPGAQRRSALAVEWRIGRTRQPFDHLMEFGAQLRELRRAQHVLEDIETDAVIGRENIGMQPAFVRETDRTAIAERHRPRFTLAEIGLHRLFLGPEIADYGRVPRVHASPPKPDICYEAMTP